MVAIADPVPGLAARRVTEWSRHPQFARTKPYTDWLAMLKEAKPGAVIIGVPPAAHGGGKPQNNIERVCAKLGVAMFIEKPLSCLPLSEVEKTAEVVRKSGVITSVGYMMRYSKVMNFAKERLAELAIKPRHIILRYACAYTEIRKREWWDVAQSGGPIIEQATHFVDVARYVGGEVNLKSVRAIALGSELPLANVPIGPDGRGVEAGVPALRRIPRMTSAHWTFAGGCLGTLTHGIFLHRTRFETDIDIWGEGTHLHVADPYHDMKVRIRRPHREDYEHFEFKGDDPYWTELDVFLRASANRDSREIRSPYEDAFKTYALTWTIARKAFA